MAGVEQDAFGESLARPEVGDGYAVGALVRCCFLPGVGWAVERRVVVDVRPEARVVERWRGVPVARCALQDDRPGAVVP